MNDQADQTHHSQDIARVFRTVTDEIVALAKRQVDAVREKGKQTDVGLLHILLGLCIG